MTETNEPDFYLDARDESSSMDELRACWRIKRISTGKSDDFLLVRIDPPVIGQPYGLGDRDITVLVIAPKWQNTSLFPINVWPMPVYVFRSLVDDPHLRDEIPLKEMEMIAWAALYRTEEDTRRRDWPIMQGYVRRPE
jgi:hypothetical protein